MSSLADSFGHFWQTLWDAPENSDLRDLRGDPNCLAEGDAVHIPDIRLQELGGACEQKHKFRRRGVPARLRMQLVSAGGQPRAHRSFRLDVDGVVTTGTTDGDGLIDTPIACQAFQAVLVLEAQDQKPEETFELQLGELAPYDSVRGAQARLRNLGHDQLVVDGELGSETTAALKAFQKANSLDPSGDLDAATADKLREIHGS